MLRVYIKMIKSFFVFEFVLLSYTKQVSEAGSWKAGVHVHLESVRVIHNVQRFSALCAGLLSLLAALSQKPAVLNGEMDAPL